MVFLKERIGKLIEEMRELIYVESTQVKSYKFIQSKERFQDVSAIKTDAWASLTNEQLWGGHREYYWFETLITIPDSYQGKCVVYELRTGREEQWDATNPQFSIYVDGVRKQGLDVNHREVLLTEDAKAGQVIRVILSAFTGEQNFKLVMDSCIKVLDRAIEKYYYDLSVPYNVARLLEESDGAYIKIITVLNESLNRMDLRKTYTKEFYESLKEAQEYLTTEFYEKYCGNSEEKVYCVGHTHIDVAWMWTLAVTEDKAVRSFSTVLELMRQYPEYTFMSSQPQLYKYVKKNAPDVYREIKERVAEGRWETEGGMFLEADCNISSGESLIRQFIYGKRFFREEFGKDNEILWLPDVFGYSAALPQIMEKCGIKYFMTTKISWNEFNKMPYDTFEWEGIDGTRILTHFSPSRDYKAGKVEGGYETEHFTTYNAYINPSQVKGAWKRYSQKYLNKEVLMSFGYGDGGGGPTRDQLENQRRLEKGLPGCPKTVMSNTRNFFHTLEDHVKEHKYLPAWVGELYLEYHRGTYTSMARNKKYNRKSEFLYENTELYSLLAEHLVEKEYPKEAIRDAWEVILRNQFHDILPGSSIKEVYEDSKEEYEGILKSGNQIVEDALYQIVEQIDAPANALVVFNPNNMQGDGIVHFVCPAGMEDVAVYDGTEKLQTQKTVEGDCIFYAKGVPSKGYKTYRLEKTLETESDKTMQTCKLQMENTCVRVTFDANGQIKTIYDKQADRQVLKENQNGNVLMTYEDKPHNYDAWDLNNYYTEKSWEITELESMELVENGPVRLTMKVVRTYLDSRIEQYISITEGSPEITIRNEIDWKEKQIFMKAIFPVDVHTDEATFEIQYGNVKRKTHYNTSWDFARFEVCMHKWIDISEDDYGVSMLNDCKYGCSVHDGTIGLSMLKSAIYPNPDADKEHHSFTFSIFPHSRGWKEAGTIQRAYLLNNPMQGRVKESKAGRLAASYSEVGVDVENVVIEVVKKAESGTEMIVRLYETYNRRSDVKMIFGRPVRKAVICNMLEEEEQELCPIENSVAFSIRPYEIKTFKITL
ncbi:MAG: alpha-mannosidase [Lachnospiraceae bacterium]|nr:alpha-mannosidase [Lachnospiraceae bacterium]